MFKTLLKKQLLELNSTFFLDKKTGKAKSKKSTIISILIFVFVMVVVLGAIFSALAYSLSELIILNLDWLYFLVLSLVSLTYGVFGSVFNTFSSLYQAKDNDTLLSLPIPVHYILFIRLIGVYLMGAMYSMVVYIPALVIYYVKATLNLPNIISPIIFGICITFIVFILSCILGYVVAQINNKIKNKSFIIVIVSLVFMGLYYYFCMNIFDSIAQLIQYALSYSSVIKDSLYPIYFIATAPQGKIAPLITVISFTIVSSYLTYYVLNRSFIKLSISKNSAKKTKKKIVVKNNGYHKALIMKEFKHLFSSATYMLNCSLATLFLLIASFMILFKGQMILEILSEFNSIIFLGILFGICMMVSINDLTAPSISLEGKNIWIIQSLPIKPIDIFHSKILLHLILTSIPAFICSLSAIFVFKFNIIDSLFIITIPLAYSIFTAIFGLCMNLKFPNLNWTRETVAVKQSIGVLISMLGSMLSVVILGFVYYLLSSYLSVEIYLVLCLIVIVIAIIISYMWLKNKGSQILLDL